MRGSVTNPERSKDEVVRRALGLFWHKGAEAASYNDIVEVTGLSRKALYSLWPDKDTLVHEAMALYRAEVLAPLVRRLDSGGRAGLAGFWDGLSAGVRTPGWTGCFLFRSAGGALRGDPVIAAHLEDHVGLLRKGIARDIRQAQAEGAISAHLDAQTAAWQSVAIASLISTYGAVAGNSKTVAALIAAGQSACGLV